MKQMAQAIQTAGKYVLSSHAKERIRQRAGITSEEVAITWVAEQVKSAVSTKTDGEKVHYITDLFEIVLAGAKVITILPTDNNNEYLTKISEVVSKEVTKVLTKQGRLLRKAEISVAEAQLNYLRAKNPNTKALISERLTEAVDRKASIEDEIYAVEVAAKRYGVSV